MAMGLELWRRLCADMRWASPAVAMANAERYTMPTRARNIAALWGQLNAWESLGVEVEASGLHLEDWQRAQALVRLLPSEMASTISSKPELRTYAEKLNWVRHQIAHERATSMAAVVAKRADDMQVG